MKKLHNLRNDGIIRFPNLLKEISVLSRITIIQTNGSSFQAPSRMTIIS
ncbi:hypothetical protein ACYULU_15305 [Breznakiellaceae bacterium SP9]